MQTEIVFTGNIGTDVEFIEKENGKKIATFSVGVKSPINKDKTIWHKVRRWDVKAEETVNKLQKGMRVNVKGHLIYDTWEDGTGNHRKSAVIEANWVERFKNEIIELNMPGHVES